MYISLLLQPFLYGLLYNLLYGDPLSSLSIVTLYPFLYVLLYIFLYIFLYPFPLSLLYPSLYLCSISALRDAL